MEDGLRGKFETANDERTAVLILVLMEDGLRGVLFFLLLLVGVVS